MKLKPHFAIVLMLSSLFVLSACGNNGKSTRDKKQSINSVTNSILADSSMRSLINKRWVCSDGGSASVLLMNGEKSQSVQITMHDQNAGATAVDYLVMNGLDCYYSSSDSRVIKCISKSDSSLKVETTLTRIAGEKIDLMAFSIHGAESSFVAYDGSANRFITLAEFQSRYHNPVSLRLTEATKCGFED